MKIHVTTVKRYSLVELSAFDLQVIERALHGRTLNAAEMVQAEQIRDGISDYLENEEDEG